MAISDGEMEMVVCATTAARMMSMVMAHKEKLLQLRMAAAGDGSSSPRV